MKRVLRMTKEEKEEIFKTLAECQKLYKKANKKTEELKKLVEAFDDEHLVIMFEEAVWEGYTEKDIMKDENIVVI